MKIEFYVKTDIGLKRQKNEDFFGYDADKNIFIVCDGMGGGFGGDFASKYAVEILLKSFEKISREEAISVIGTSTALNDRVKRLASAIKLANRSLYHSGSKERELAGMGTTLVVSLFDENGSLHLLHVGDSRMYRVRGGRIDLLTKDHSKVNELMDMGKLTREDVKTVEIQGMITRAIGVSPSVKIDYRTEVVRSGDIYVMCTDGINGELEDSVIRDIVSINKSSVGDIAKELIIAANNNGGKDNSTVIALKVIECPAEVNKSIMSDNFGNVITIPEENVEQSGFLGKILAKKIKEYGINSTLKSRKKNFFRHPFISGSIIGGVLIFFAALFMDIGNTKPGSSLTDLTGNVVGVSIEVRVPNEEQFIKFSKASETVKKLQIIKDWQLEKEKFTKILSDVQIKIFSEKGDEYSGISGLNPLDVELSPGEHLITASYPGYKIISDKVGYKENIGIVLEYSKKLRPVLILLVPERRQ